MAFVNELIPEAEKEKFTFPVRTELDGSKPTLYKWTIDKEKDVFLVVVNAGGGGHLGSPVIEHYVLNWKGNLIRFVGEQQLGGSKDTGITLSWKVHQLDIPSSLIARKEDVLELIREALDAQGWLYDRSRVVSVNTEFDHHFC